MQACLGLDESCRWVIRDEQLLQPSSGPAALILVGG